jgi:hypothetical protein
VDEDIIETTRRWIDRFVVDLNLCPFARRELERNRVRFAVSRATDPEALAVALQRELECLVHDESIETTMLIHPAALTDFFHYNQFLAVCEAMLQGLGLEGELQIASFHPHYQFAGTDPDDPENYSNRSPYPMLHLLRETSVAQAVDNHPDVEGIPERNMDTLRALGRECLQARREACLQRARER